MKIQLNEKLEFYYLEKAKKQKTKCTYFKTFSPVLFLVHVRLSVSPKQQKNTLFQKKEG